MMPKAAPKLPKINKCPVCDNKARCTKCGFGFTVDCSNSECLWGPKGATQEAAIAAWNKLRSDK